MIFIECMLIYCFSSDNKILFQKIKYLLENLNTVLLFSFISLISSAASVAGGRDGAFRFAYPDCSGFRLSTEHNIWFYLFRLKINLYTDNVHIHSITENNN